LTYGPNVHYTVQRYTKIRATWQEIAFDGELKNKSEIFENVIAQIFQHETDHVNGITIAMIGQKISEPKLI
jgi:peptide deformylase